MLQLLSATPLIAVEAVAIDTETTGLDVRNDRVIEMAAVQLDGSLIDEAGAWSTLVRTERPIPEKASAIHGLYSRDLADAPAFAPAYAGFVSRLNGRLVIGHTVGFDTALLANECARHGLKWVEPPFLDVRVLAQIVAPHLPGYSLEALAAWLNVDVQNRHRALGDALAAARIFVALAPRLREVGVRSVGEALAACRRTQDALNQGRPAVFAGASDPLGAAATLQRLDPYPYQHRVRDVMSAPPVFVPAGTPVDAALKTLVEQKISAVFVGEPDDIGCRIFTERDLLRIITRDGVRVLSRPIGDFAVGPLVSLPDSAFVYRALGRMARMKIRHLAVSGMDGRIVGMVTSRDLLKLRTSSAIELGDDIDCAGTVAELGRAWAKIAAMARHLRSEGIEARDISGIIARELGALTRRAAVLGERRLGAEGSQPPCAYAVLVLGSAGRGESLLAMDQDNAIVFARGDPDGPEDTYFARLGGHIADILHEVGVPYCTGGVMASKPAFRGSVELWRERFRRWISRSNPEDLLATDITYDFRAVHGDLAMAHTLRTEVWSEARHAIPFLKLLALNGEGGEAALSLFGNLRRGEDGRIDLKNAGLRKIVTAARVMALRHGVVAHATQDRLLGLRELDVGGDADLTLYDSAHQTVLDAILRQQLADIAAGIPPSNRVDPRILGKDGAAKLKSALASLGSIDEMVRDQLS